jgi:hypothetical protein
MGHSAAIESFLREKCVEKSPAAKNLLCATFFHGFSAKFSPPRFFMKSMDFSEMRGNHFGGVNRITFVC